MTSFFACMSSLHAFSLNPTCICKHCGCADQFVSHGFVYQKQQLDSPKSIGKRILCSNRFGRSGCGRTARLSLSDSIPYLHYSASIILSFLLILMRGHCVVSAFQQATGRVNTRQAWRWLHRFTHQLPHWRSHLAFPLSVTSYSLRSPRLQNVLSSLDALFSTMPVPSCATLQMRWQLAFC